MIYSAPLEDARHLVNHYDRLRQEVEAQVNSLCFLICFESIYNLKKPFFFLMNRRLMY